MMGVERGNLDLLILALVGSAALIYDERRVGRACGAIAFLGLGVALKLFPMFCVSLAARFSRQTFIFACVSAGGLTPFIALTPLSHFFARISASLRVLAGAPVPDVRSTASDNGPPILCNAVAKSGRQLVLIHRTFERAFGGADNAYADRSTLKTGRQLIAAWCLFKNYRSRAFNDWARVGCEKS
jgi:hypothetical protein